MFWVESFSSIIPGSPFRDLFVHDYLHRSRSTNAGPILIMETDPGSELLSEEGNFLLVAEQ